MPGIDGPSSEWPLTVTFERPAWPIPDPTESFFRYSHTGEMVLTIRGHSDDVGRVFAAIQPVLAEMGMLASGGVVRPMSESDWIPLEWRSLTPAGTTTKETP